MATHSYIDWLNDYQTRVSQMSPSEIRQENHEDERHPSQIYADYLDYVDEWTWHQKEQVSVLTSSTVYSLSQRRQKMKCGDHEHTLVRAKQELDNEGCVIVDAPNRAIHHECWYRTIRSTVEEVLNTHSRANVRMPDPLETALSRIASWRLVQSDTSPTLLPFDTFKTVWWNAAENGGTSKLATDMLQRLNLADRQQIAELRAREIPEVRPQQQHIILWYPHSDHGLHALQRAVGKDEFNKLLRFINRARQRRGTNERIKLEEIELRKSSCEYCKTERPKRQLSQPGIYYAPPGIGKTTAMNEELIVGLDTDWIGSKVTWHELSPVLNMRIPIITNQSEGFVGSGLKVIGVYNEDIRQDTHGIPYTTIEAIEANAKAQTRNYNLTRVKRDTYFADWTLHMQVGHILQQMIAEHCINRMPFYRAGTDEEWSKWWVKLMKDPDIIHTT